MPDLAGAERGIAYLDRIAAHSGQAAGSIRPDSRNPVISVSDGHPSEDAVALAFAASHGDRYRYVAPWHRWLHWNGQVWREDSTALVYQEVRNLIRNLVGGSKAERSTANAAFVSGVENIAAGHQQINNGIPAHAGQTENPPSKLLEADSAERLDSRTPSTAGGANQELETVGAFNGSHVLRGKGARKPEQLQGRDEGQVTSHSKTATAD